MSAVEQRPLVAAFLGTDHHPFDRLVSWVSDLADDGTWEWCVQHGSTPLTPGVSGVTGAEMLDADDLRSLMGRASAVVTHGGPGLIMEARAAGHLPVVVPRDPTRGEHVDDHQQLFSRRLAREGQIILADDSTALREALVQQVRRGRRVASGTTAGLEASRRLGELVDELLADRARAPRSTSPRRRLPLGARARRR